MFILAQQLDYFLNPFEIHVSLSSLVIICHWLHLWESSGAAMLIVNRDHGFVYFSYNFILS